MWGGAPASYSPMAESALVGRDTPPPTHRGSASHSDPAAPPPPSAESASHRRRHWEALLRRPLDALPPRQDRASSAALSSADSFDQTSTIIDQSIFARQSGGNAGEHAMPSCAEMDDLQNSYQEWLVRYPPNIIDLSRRAKLAGLASKGIRRHLVDNQPKYRRHATSIQRRRARPQGKFADVELALVVNSRSPVLPLEGFRRRLGRCGPREGGGGRGSFPPKRN